MDDDGSGEARHPIRIAAKRTGLSPARLRAWERRYAAVRPSRTEGGQRLYSEAEVDRLTLLRRVVQAGRSIGQVASLSLPELKILAREDEVEGKGHEGSGAATAEPIVGLLKAAKKAVERMDPDELDRVLKRGAVLLPVTTLVDEILEPFLEEIEATREGGTLRQAERQFTSVGLRSFLYWLLRTVSMGEGAPVFLAVTPQGQGQELRGLLTAVSAGAEEWRALFFGPDLSAGEISVIAQSVGAQVVARSATNQADSHVIREEVGALRSGLTPAIRMMVAGPKDPLSLQLSGVEEVGKMRELRDAVRVPVSLNESRADLG